MERNVRDILNLYNPHDSLDHAWTIPSPWYFDQAIARLEQDNVFATTWQVVGRVEHEPQAARVERGPQRPGVPGAVLAVTQHARRRRMHLGPGESGSLEALGQWRNGPPAGGDVEAESAHVQTFGFPCTTGVSWL